MRPPATQHTVVVVGAGLAGARTVAALRAGGHRGRLILLGAEGVAPYDRPPLSKELFTRTEPAWLDADMGIDVAALADDCALNSPARSLRRTTNGWSVATREREFAADDVVLAVGARPVNPWPGAATLHTSADAAALRAVLPGARVAIVGAGWIGAELAGQASAAGADVTVIEAARVPLGDRLGNRVGKYLVRWYHEAGVRLRTGTSVTGVSGPTPARHGPGHATLLVQLAQGEALDCDVVVAAIGVRPATRWIDVPVLRGPTGAITCDPQGRALAPPTGEAGAGPDAIAGLWAVGDCAARRHPLFGTVPGGHWSAALHDPEATAAAMLGIDAPRAHAPYVFSRQFGHDVAVFGAIGPGDPLIVRGDPAADDGWLALYPDPGAQDVVRLRAVVAVDSPRTVGTLRSWFAQPQLPRVNIATASDPGRMLRDALEP